MLAYEKHLLTSCENWFKTNYSDLHTSYKANNADLAYAVNYPGSNWQACSPGYQLMIGIGPWKSLYIKFKKPGEALSSEEKYVLGHLRDQGHRVAIIRYIEDFKTLINAYIGQNYCIRY